MVSGAVNRYSKEMGEDKLRSLMWKGSFTSRARRSLFVLLLTFVFVLSYQYSRHSRQRWAASLRPKPIPQLGVHADVQDEQARIAKISILYGNPSRAYERALQTHKRHNRKHGYPMFIQRVDVLDGYWTKPAFLHYMILRELRKPESERLQWLFWFDADTVVLNYNIAMEEFLPPDQDEVLRKVQILVAEDWNGLNNGIFGVRVSRYAAELFAGILAFRDFEPDTPLPFQDQSAMEYMLKRRKFINHVASVPQRWFNAYETEDEDPGPDRVHPGDFLVHFAGVGEREKHISKWADRSDQMSSKWNVPLMETDYPLDLDRFWNRTKSMHVARVTQWNNGKTHLEQLMKKINETVYEWLTTPEVTTDAFQLVTRSYANAEQFLVNTTRWGEDAIVKEDLHDLSKVVLELEDSSAKFLEGTKDRGKEAWPAKERDDDDEARKFDVAATKKEDFDTLKDIEKQRNDADGKKDDAEKKKDAERKKDESDKKQEEKDKDKQKEGEDGKKKHEENKKSSGDEEKKAKKSKDDEDRPNPTERH